MKISKKISDWFCWITMPKWLRDDLRLIELETKMMDEIIENRKLELKPRYCTEHKNIMFTKSGTLKVKKSK
jgi:hypothetical protein